MAQNYVGHDFDIVYAEDFQLVFVIAGNSYITAMSASSNFKQHARTVSLYTSKAFGVLCCHCNLHIKHMM